tara:strand:+ start:954 stop:2081 length:1128 start_codon:yes stop_codon:yes gene_type:complete
MSNLNKLKKNITIVVSAMNMGGAQRVVSILCNYWSQNGYSVTLIYTYTKKRIHHYHLNDKVEIKYLKNIPFLSNIYFLNAIWKLIYLRSSIKSSNPDVIISFLTTINVATTLASIGIKAPLFICERISTPFATLNKNLFWFYKILFKRVKKIIVQTENNKSYLNETFPKNDVDVIPNLIIYPIPVTGRSINPHTVIAENRKSILAAGRMHKFKQFDVLIKAFNMIKDIHSEWDLIILGDGEEKTKLHQLLSDYKINNRVFFPGSVGNVSEWYENVDLFVLSSLVEGFPNVLLEAMSYGLPCVSFDCETGPRELIKNGINGILVNPHEKETGLSKAISSIINQPEMRENMGKEAIKLKRKNSIENIISKWNISLNL